MTQRQPDPPRDGTRVEPIDDATAQADLSMAEGFVHPEGAGVSRGQIVKWVALLAVTGVSVYVIWPTLNEVFSATSRLSGLEPAWVAASVLAEVVSVAISIVLVSEAIRSKAWFSITMSQLASNAAGRVVPGGAAGGALQYKMLVEDGASPTTVITGLAAMNIIITAVPLALPVFAMPVVLGGTPVPKGLVDAAWIGVAAFVLLFIGGVALLTTERPLRLAAGLFQSARNRIRRRHAPMEGLPDRIIRERDLLRRTLGSRWWIGVGAAAGFVIFDYLALLAALAAVGAHPNPALVLLAYVASRVLALIPLTPGGVGFVEAGLVGMLVLAGVDHSDALLASLTYRLVSYWLPLPVGAVAYGAFVWRRNRRPAAEPA